MRPRTSSSSVMLVLATMLIAMGMLLTTGAQAKYGEPNDSPGQHAQRKMQQVQNQSDDCVQACERLKLRYQQRIQACLDDDDPTGAVAQVRNCIRAMQRRVQASEARMTRTCENACQQLCEMNAGELGDQIRQRVRDCEQQIDQVCLQIRQQLRDQVCQDD